MKRIIRPVPLGTIELYNGAIVNGKLDYITSDEVVPVDALYVANMDEQGVITVEKDMAVPFEHTYAGWPVPGEPIVEEIV